MDAIPLKELCSLAAIGLTVVAFLPYIVAILRGGVRPHVFSWMIWGMTTCVVFFAQLEDGGGAGAWPIGVSGTITVGIAWLAYVRRADITVTAVDRVFLLAALSALPFWFFTSDPMWAVLVLTAVDLLGFGPTLRKAYVLPYSESLTFPALFAVRNALAILALEHYSLTTVLFPAAIGVVCIVLVLLLACRRARIARPA